MAQRLVFSRRHAMIALAALLVLMIPMQLTLHHQRHPLRQLQHSASEATHAATALQQAPSAPPPAPSEPPEDESRVEAVLACYDNPHYCSSLGAAREECYSNKTVSQQLCKVSCDTCESLKQSIASDMDVDVEIRDSFICSDEDELCRSWWAKGLCAKRPRWMLARCKATCAFCQTDPNFGQDSATTWADFCADDVDLCPYWAKIGSCGSYPWMRSVCRRSCKHCDAGKQAHRLERIQQLSQLRDPNDPSSCADFNVMCPRYAAKGLCSSNQRYMSDFCKLSCGLCSGGGLVAGLPVGVEGRQALFQGRQGVGQLITGSGRAVSELINAQHLQPLPAHGSCRDHGQFCKDWVAKGQCEANPAYMLADCKLSCGVCTMYWTMRVRRTVKLGSGHSMPVMGFGTAALGDDTERAVLAALKAGYRHFDSAQAREWYREDLVGSALAKAPHIKREQLFLTSKLHPRHHGYNSAKARLQQSLDDLGTPYLDLFLLHYPSCWGSLCGPGERPEGTWRDSWRALEELQRAGKVRDIGVSNFALHEMQELLKLAKVPPAVLQAHADPLNQNTPLVTFCQEHGIVFTAYSTLGTQAGGDGGNPVVSDPTIAGIAMQLDRSAVQVVLRWAMQRGMVAIPRSSNEQHMASNLQAFDFQLTLEQMQQMAALDKANSQQ